VTQPPLPSDTNTLKVSASVLHVNRVELPDDIRDAGPRQWFAPSFNPCRLAAAGIKQAGGGAHQSKTMMLGAIEAYLTMAGDGVETARQLIVEQNVLGKPTLSARRQSLFHLQALYGIITQPPIGLVFSAMWQRGLAGRPVLALLTALARDPLFRLSADPVLSAPLGSSVRWTAIAAEIEARYPGRFSPKMLKSLAQNCASSWTQSGHLTGKIDKRRSRADVSPQAAAYAVWLATITGFGGPALLTSLWLKALGQLPGELLSSLRLAEAQGLLRIRTAGEVSEIMVRRTLAETLRIPALAEL
jgi:hypothetical protein